MVQLRDDLNRLVDPQDSGKTLAKPSARNPIPAQSGLAQNTDATGSGIDSPLTEPDFTKRTWHPTQLVYSSDGVIAIEVRHLATLNLVDASNRAVVFNFADKP